MKTVLLSHVKNTLTLSIHSAKDNRGVQPQPLAQVSAGNRPPDTARVEQKILLKTLHHGCVSVPPNQKDRLNAIKQVSQFCP